VKTEAVAVTGLVKRYGKSVAVADLTLAIPDGAIWGLLGPNGAGKTTTFRCLLGLVQPNAGEITFWGRSYSYRIFTDVAYVPEQSTLYEWMRGREYLEFTRRAHPSYDSSLARTLLDRFDLDPNKRVRELSKGERTALMVVMAFARHPRLLILDEPTSGLDPIHQRHVLDLVVESAATGATVLFSSHQITHIERAADRVSILKNGRLLLNESVDSLKERQKVIEATFEREVPPLNGVARDPRIARVDRMGKVLRLHVHDRVHEIVHELERMSPTSITVIDCNLEDIFMDAIAVGAPHPSG